MWRQENIFDTGGECKLDNNEACLNISSKNSTHFAHNYYSIMIKISFQIKPAKRNFQSTTFLKFSALPKYEERDFFRSIVRSYCVLTGGAD